MSDEMAIGDNASSEEAKVNGDEATAASALAPEAIAVGPQIESETPPADDTTAPAEDVPEVKQENIEDVEVKQEPESLDVKLDAGDDLNKEIKTEDEEKRGIKRRASTAFSDTSSEDFKGFETVTQSEWDSMYSQVYHRIVGRLEAEVTAAVKDHTPLRTVMATPLAPGRASKRLRQDTDGSRPSSALSSRSDGDGVISTDATSAASSPAQRGRRSTTEMSSPLLRVPLERGWKRELVYRAALDAHSRRNADIYYYTPQGKKLRSTREVNEHLSGTGLSIENFSFWKEPLGLDDPEKEIIRYAKVQQRRVESPVSAPPPAEGKRTPKPKQPKGASPDPPIKSPPIKLKVKSLGSRLNTSGQTASPATPAANKQKKPATPASTTDNNNSAAWKKPRPPAAQLPQSPQPQQTQPQPQAAAPQPQTAAPQPQLPPRPCTPPQPPPPLQSRPPPSPDVQSPRQLVQPCSMTCGRGLPTLACAVCLCLYHPACVGYKTAHPPSPILCKNCRKSSSPPLDPPPLTHKSGVTATNITSSISAPVPRRVPAPVPVPVPVPVSKGARPEKRVLLRMKVAGGGPDGERVWAVAKPQTQPPQLPQPQLHQLQQPQSYQLPQQQLQQLQQSQQQLPQQQLHQLPPPQQLHQIQQQQVHQLPQQQLHQLSQPQTHQLSQQQLHQLPQPQLHQMPQPQTRPLPVASPRALALRASLPQSLAILNGKKFIVVPRSIVQPQHENRTRSRLANGASSPPSASPAPVVASPRRRGRPRVDDTDYFTAFYNKAQEKNYNVVVQIFQYLGMRDLAHCTRVCRLWKQLASTPALWRHVRMKNSHVSDWGGLCDALKRHGTKRLDLRKMLLPQNDTVFWEQFAQHISKVDTLERIEMCRCPARAVEAVMSSVPGLRSLAALAIRDARLDPAALASLPRLQELRLKSMAGLSLARDLRPLATLRALQHLSLTSIKDLGWCLCDVVGQLPQLETLELGECTFRAEFASTLRGLSRLRRLRLERGTAHCAAPAILRALAHLPLLTRLELVNIDVKVGFDDALAECKNIQRLLIIPTYVSQSATTNKQVLSGVLRLKDTLTHLMWGVTIELLRVTELFIDQCEQEGGDAKKRDVGECIPVLKPVPGCKLPDEHHHVAGPPQVEILPLPTLQRLLSSQLPNTKLKLLRIPFHATWRQSLADFQ